MSERPEIRIGDRERSDATDSLQQHLAEGRLTVEEFDERVGKALTARTQHELDGLFVDLPGYEPEPPPAPAQNDFSFSLQPIYQSPFPMPVPARMRPGFDISRILPVMIPGAVILLLVSGFKAWPIIALVLLGVFIFTRVAKAREAAAEPQAGLTDPARAEINRMLLRGDRKAAIGVYRTHTGSSRMQANAAINNWHKQID